MNRQKALIFCVLMVLFGVLAWYSLLSGSQEEHMYEFNSLVEQAERYAEHGVDQKAYESFVEAYEMMPGYEIAIKTAKAAQTLENYSKMKTYYLAAISYDNTQAEPYEQLMGYYIRTKAYASAFEIYAQAEAVSDREQLDAYYEQLHGGFEEGYINISEFEGWHYAYGVAKIGELAGILNASASAVTAFSYEEIGMYNSTSDLVPVKSDGTWLYCSTDGVKNSLAVGYDVYGNFGNGYAPVCVNGKYGYIDEDGNCYDSVNKKWISFDEVEENGGPAFEYDYAGAFTYSVAAVQKDGKWALISADGMELITDFVFDDVILNAYGYCANGKVVIAKQSGSYHLYAIATGSQIGDASFEDAKPFESTEAAAICQNGLWGFADTAGQIVVESQYEDAISFNVGYAPVKKDGLWGYIDSTGALEAEPQFEWISAFSTKGVAFVRYPEAENLRKITLYEYID